MYTPRRMSVTNEDAVRAMVADVGAGWLVTAGDDGTPEATLMPIVWRESTVFAHMARANPQHRRIGDGTRALMIVAGPQTYVTPSWYPSKAEHGRVLPTWNYTAVHLSGPVVVHDDPEWLRAVVVELTDVLEAGRDEPWAVSDAPEDFVAAELRGIVGVELNVERVEAKAKLSQGRTESDRAGLIDGLERESHDESRRIAAAMRRPPTAIP